MPILVLSARTAEPQRLAAFEAGADDFVRKPFKPVELVARIRGQLRLRGAIDALEKKGQDARLVLELTQALASNLDFRGILFTVVQRIAEVARVDRVSIVLVREAGDVGYVVAASDDEQLRDLPIDLAKYPEIQQVLSSREPLVVPDIATHPLLEIVRHEGHRTAFSSLAILPILYEGRPMGVLFLRAKHAFTFGEAELELCKTVSNAMAIALRNARVMQSLRDQTQQVTVARFEAACRRIHHHQRQIRIRHSVEAALNPQRLHQSFAFANSGCIHQPHRNSLDRRHFRNHVARGAGYVRHNRPILLQQTVEQTALADIGTSEDREFETFTQHLPVTGTARQPFQLASNRLQPRAQLAGARHADIVLREINSGFQQRDQFQQLGLHGFHFARQGARDLAGRHARLMQSGRFNQIAHRFGLRKINAPV